MTIEERKNIILAKIAKLKEDGQDLQSIVSTLPDDESTISEDN